MRKQTIAKVRAPDRDIWLSLEEYLAATYNVLTQIFEEPSIGKDQARRLVDTLGAAIRAEHGRRADLDRKVQQQQSIAKSLP